MHHESTAKKRQKFSEDTFYLTDDQSLKWYFVNEKHWIFSGFTFEENLQKIDINFTYQILLSLTL